jgi:hypothetical protein
MQILQRRRQELGSGGDGGALSSGGATSFDDDGGVGGAFGLLGVVVIDCAYFMSLWSNITHVLGHFDYNYWM